MTRHFYKQLMLIAAIALAPLSTLAATGSIYPSSVLKNQFGETSINAIVGGSGAIDCVFTVNAADSGGKGITGLSGPACSSVYMHTGASPAVGNPNPASGYILVNLGSPFYGFNGATISLSGQLAASAGNVTSGVTGGNPYVISSVGTTSSSQWQHLGLPVGVIPAVGAAFIASSTTTATGTGAVKAPNTVAGGVSMIDVIGAPASGLAATAGGQMIFSSICTNKFKHYDTCCKSSLQMGQSSGFISFFFHYRVSFTK